MLSWTIVDNIKGIRTSLARDGTFSYTPIYMLRVKLNCRYFLSIHLFFISD